MFAFKKTFPHFMYRSQIVQNVLIKKKRHERLNAMEQHKRHRKKNHKFSKEEDMIIRMRKMRRHKLNILQLTDGNRAKFIHS